LVDAIRNQLIEFQEVSSYVNQQQFQLLDRNGNGVIDCGDIGELPPVEGEPGVEGEIIIEGEPPVPETDPCDWVEMALNEFVNLDQNNDGVITRDELNFPIIMIYPPIVDFDVLFQEFDLDSNGAITKAELEAWADMCDIDTGNNGECPLPTMTLQSILELVFPYIDQNGDGKLSPDEVRNIYPDVDNALSQYNFTLEQIYFIVDGNHDGGVTINELMPILSMLAPQIGLDPNNVLSIIDKNGDLMISYEEVSEYVTAEQFAYVDSNGNGYIDCNDLDQIVIPPWEGELPPWEGELPPWEGELPPWEGELPPWEGEMPPINWNTCELGAIALQYFDILDVNSDGAITLEELLSTPVITVIPLPIDPAIVGKVFDIFDVNADGKIIKDEIKSIIDACPELPPIEGEPPIPIEGEFEIPTDPCVIAPLALKYFDWIDRNKDGRITMDELTGPVIMTVSLPIDISVISEVFRKFDLNGDEAIIKDEIKSVLDTCSGGPVEGEPTDEGEIVIFPDLWNPCSLAFYAIQMFNTIDQNKDGVIDMNEIITAITSVYMMPIDQTWLTRILSMLDLDNNGAITLNELQSISERCQSQSSETGGPGPGPGGNEPPTSLILERAVSGNRRYWSGQTLTVILTIRNPIHLNVSALGLKETLPTGWVLQSVVETSNAVVVPSNGATGTLEFAWMDIPPFPVKVVYNVSVPNDADGQAVISGYVLYRTVDSEELSSPVVDTVLLKGWSPDRAHSADSNRDWSISLTEMLRVIQMFNFGGYSCDDTSEDGFGPGEGKNRNCVPHSGDYQPQDWKFNLSELLRQIQLYNAPGKGYILQEGTEDGFAPLLN
ncbi:MAG: EF-hand domain-containing protein, partial [Candidatus Hydrogenedens sp.]